MKIMSHNVRNFTAIFLAVVLFMFIENSYAQDNDFYTKAHVDALETRIAALEAKLDNLTIENGVVNGLPGPHFVITGANLHIRNGSGGTHEDVNGLGNLILGYNEARSSPEVNIKSGSHNCVIGGWHNFSSHGGLVAGVENEISGESASVSGGFHNIAIGKYASVTGGTQNQAIGRGSSISGGANNRAGAPGVNNSSVSGGNANHAVGESASISGGMLNRATHRLSSISGGRNNYAIAEYTSVTGGFNNSASGNASSVSGGQSNNATGDFRI